jgi:hypothetical protein
MTPYFLMFSKKKGKYCSLVQHRPIIKKKDHQNGEHGINELKLKVNLEHSFFLDKLFHKKN